MPPGIPPPASRQHIADFEDPEYGRCRGAAEVLSSLRLEIRQLSGTGENDDSMQLFDTPAIPGELWGGGVPHRRGGE
ncbi:MAG: hypothetical protein ACOVRM_18915, partial [Planctomycetaceae bacterium]